MKRKLSLLAMLATVVIVTVTVGYSASGQKKFPKKAHITIPFTLAPSGTLLLPELPPGVPVTIDGVCTTPTFQGIGTTKIHRVVGSSGNYFEWVGSDISSAAVQANFGFTLGDTIVSFDFNGALDLEVFDSGNLQLKNYLTFHPENTLSGVLTISW